MFSFLVSSVVVVVAAESASPSLRRLLGEPPAPRRRANDFGLKNSDDEDLQCDLVAHTWDQDWAAYVGHIEFAAPEMVKGFKYAVKSKDGSAIPGPVVWWEGDAPYESGDAWILDPKDSWYDEHLELRHYVNFGAGAPDLATGIEVFFCYTPISFDLYLDSTNDLAGTIASLAGFLAQASWESGRFTACDESNHSGDVNASCSQREDGGLYQDVNTGTHACALDKTMAIKATTSTLECKPDDDDTVEGESIENCCWWGRGALQTTGPTNYGALQYNIVSKSDSFSDTDLCTNPGLVCQEDELKFLSGVYFWVTEVQADECFTDSLAKYVEAYDATAVPNDDCHAFAYGVGGKVNNGAWNSHAHGEDCTANENCDSTPDGRVERFKALMVKAKTALDAYTTPDAEAPACTGDSAVDTILHSADFETASEISAAGSVYTWNGFCEALKEFINEE